MRNKLLLTFLLIFANNTFSFSIDDRKKLCNNGDVGHCRQLIYEYIDKNNKDMTNKYFDADFDFMMQQKGDKTLFNSQQYYELAKEFFKKSCDGNDHYGCSNLGFMYMNGKGVVENLVIGKNYLKKSEKYLKKECPRGGGNSMECAYLAVLYGDYYKRTGLVLFETKK